MGYGMTYELKVRPLHQRLLRHYRGYRMAGFSPVKAAWCTVHLTWLIWRTR
jgi:hypothetical protein